METTIKQVSPAEYELEIRATSEELAPDLTKALKAQRAQASMKGFRPGKVPLSLIKKMFGQAIAFQVAEQRVQETYEAEVLAKGEHEVLGPPQLTRLDYEMDRDLDATIRFGVRPEIALKDLSSERLTKLVHAVTDEDVEGEIERLRAREADLVPVEEGAAAGEEDHVLVDLQRLDDASGTPVIGQKEEDVAFFLNDPLLKDELREAVAGKRVGDAFRVNVPHEGEHEGEEAAPTSGLILPPGGAPSKPRSHTHPYRVTVKEVKRRELPELDEAFIGEATGGKAQDEEALRRLVRERLEEAWKARSREYLEAKIVERMVALHADVPVPDPVVETYLDAFVGDVKQQGQGRLPEGFDEAAFREANREEAEQQARWMLLRDRVVKEESLEATEEDLDAYFEEQSSEELSADLLRRYYASVPNLMDQVEQQVVNKKVFAALADRFELVEKDREALEEEISARRPAEAAGAEAEAAGAGATEEAPTEAAEPAETSES